jgi:hypothetical protein
MWNKKLLELGYSQREIEEDETISGEIYMENGVLFLDYPVLCNVNDVEKYLYEWFGGENVESDLF